MEHHPNEVNDAPHLPDDLPNDEDRSEISELAAELFREQAAGPIPLGTAISDQGADEVLLVETISESEPIGIVALTEDELIGTAANTDLGIDLGANPDADLEIGIPWYQSRWTYLGAGLLLTSAAVAIGSVVLLRGLNQRKRRNQRKTGQLRHLAGQLTTQTGKLTGQAQGRLRRLTHRSQSAITNFKPLRRRRNGRGGLLINRTQQQLNTLSAQAGDQLRSLSATTTHLMSRTQEGATQISKNVTLGAKKTRVGLRRGWRLSRTSLIGAAAGMLWTYLYAPQSGETTRQHLSHLLPPLRSEE